MRHASQEPLPMAWNSACMIEWETFLTALNRRVQQEQSSSAFVATVMAGPTASLA
jgi:hypothetical protein